LSIDYAKLVDYLIIRKFDKECTEFDECTSADVLHYMDKHIEAWSSLSIEERDFIARRERELCTAGVRFLLPDAMMEWDDDEG
jgi:hypothetical protein